MGFRILMNGIQFESVRIVGAIKRRHVLGQATVAQGPREEVGFLRTMHQSVDRAGRSAKALRVSLKRVPGSRLE